MTHSRCLRPVPRDAFATRWLLQQQRVPNVAPMEYNDGRVGAPLKPVRLTSHARGVAEGEVLRAVREGTREPAKLGRMLCRFNFAFNQTWQGSHYAVKQVAPVIKEEAEEIVVITIYTFYF